MRHNIFLQKYKITGSENNVVSETENLPKFNVFSPCTRHKELVQTFSMSDKKVGFAEGDIGGEFSASMEAPDTEDGKVSRFKGKHSLDSDEEDNPDNYDLMKEDDIEGKD